MGRTLHHCHKGTAQSFSLTHWILPVIHLTLSHLYWAWSVLPGWSTKYRKKILSSGVSRIFNICCLLHWLNSILWIKSREIQYLPQETRLGLSQRFHMHRIHAASKDSSLLTEGGAGITGLLSLCKQYRYHIHFLYYSIDSNKSTEFSLPQGYCFSDRLTQWLVFICWDKLHKNKK